MPPGRTIFHVDLDAFYVSVEVRDDPGLKGLPVVVGADPEGGKGRGVVVACSYEARKFGLRSGMPISTAYRLCPQATYLPPHWKLYEDASTEVMKTLKTFADDFEQSSIDEAFLDVSRKAQDPDAARALALEVKRTVLGRHGLTCSIGVAPNKSAAKIASDRSKPDGLTVVPADDIRGFLRPLPVTVIPGVGRKTADFLKTKGVETVGQLQAVDGKQLVSWFGKNGVWLWGVANGEERVEVREQEMPKSLSVERTFREDLDDFASVRREAQEAASELFGRTKAARLAYRVGGIKIRFRGFETHTRERTLPAYTEAEGPLQDTVASLLDEFEELSKPVRLVGIRVADLKRSTGASSLDAWTGD